jgi:hypothetical protein
MVRQAQVYENLLRVFYSCFSQTHESCPHCPTFLFASPKRKVAKEKGDFGPMALPAQK